jgi:choline dehydrogenase-like flavoprotein
MTRPVPAAPAAATPRGEPNGLGNNTDQVGRHLQGHLYGGAVGIFDEVVADLVGPGPSISTCDFRHHNAGIIGGAMLTNGFVPTPVGLHQMLVNAGAVPLHGFDAKPAMRRNAVRFQQINGPVHEVTTADSRVRLDPAVRDRFGIPVARLSGGLHAEDERTQSFVADRAEEWLRASGAIVTTRWEGVNRRNGPSGGQHQAGTARMGFDPATSVTDKWGRVWGHDNLRIVDGSLNVTNGGVNPVLTIFANSFRVMDHMVGSRPPAGCADSACES